MGRVVDVLVSEFFLLVTVSREIDRSLEVLLLRQNHPKSAERTMSQEHVESFVAKIKGDAALAEELKGKNANEVVAIAAQHGFTVTAPELIRHHAATISQLSDDQLDEVAGGGWFSDIGHAFSDAGQWVYHHRGEIETAGEVAGEIAE